ncbi:MAG: hypothetical protein ACMXYE_00520 [Candidatus Woesearchaeota archaeon]
MSNAAKNQRFIVIVLAVLLVVAIGYIFMDKWQTSREARQVELFQEGAQIGYEQAIFQLINAAATCQPVPVFAALEEGNVTLNLIAVECLQEPGQDMQEADLGQGLVEMDIVE